MRLPKQKFDLKRFLGDKHGVAAVEFAMLVPFLLLLFIGVTEATIALNNNQKVSQVASSVADLVAQAETISNADVTDIMRAAREIMAPYDTTSLKVTIASVSFNKQGKPLVDWSRDQNKGTPWAPGAKPPIDIPAAISIPNTSLIIGESNYTYTARFSVALKDAFPLAAQITMSDHYFLKPRLTSKVQLN